MDVRTLCLGALTLGDATGYEIRKMFEEGVFSHFLEASYGSIYPALTRLTEEELVTCHSEQQEKRPDKKIYSVTDKGRAAFTEALLEPLAEDKFRSEFLFVMLFAHLLTPERIKALIDEKVEEHRQLSERLSGPAEIGTPAADFIKDFGAVVHKASVDYLEKNRHKVEAIAGASPPRASEAPQDGNAARPASQSKSDHRNPKELARIR
jgi:DNA-binding PadR family transcriptional regulator